MNSVKKTALVTGASSGFGREFVKLFAQDGYNLSWSRGMKMTCKK